MKKNKILFTIFIFILSLFLKQNSSFYSLSVNNNTNQINYNEKKDNHDFYQNDSQIKEAVIRKIPNTIKLKFFSLTYFTLILSIFLYDLFVFKRKQNYLLIPRYKELYLCKDDF